MFLNEVKKVAREDVNLCVVSLISVFRVSYYKDIVWGKRDIVQLELKENAKGYVVYKGMLGM